MRRLISVVLFTAAAPLLASDDLFLDISPEVIFADPGATIVQTVTVVNHGQQSHDARVTFALPPGSTSVTPVTFPSSWDCGVTDPGIVCSGVAPAQSDTQLVFRYALPNSSNGLYFTGRATVGDAAGDPSPSVRTYLVVAYRTYQVTTADDGGAGSLRDVIGQANAGCEILQPCKITFASPMTIEPRTPLPPITACGVLIDGGTIAPEDRFAPHFERARRIEISGDRVSAGNGLEFRSTCGSRVDLDGVAVNGFPQNGVVVASSTPLSVESADVFFDGTFIGTDVTGTIAKPNGWRGVSFETPTAGGSFNRSIISSNGRSGIFIWSARRVDVGSSIIGGSAAGGLLPNGASGIYTNAGLLNVDGSRIVGNHEFGIAVGAGAQSVVTQSVTINGNGGLGVDWGMDGPTASDPAGRMPGVPRLTEAFYDAARRVTVVRGVVMIDPSGSYRIQPYASGATSPGYGGDAPISGATMLAKGSGDTPFELDLPGDWRGYVITALSERYLFPDLPPNDTSEFSGPLLVP